MERLSPFACKHNRLFMVAFIMLVAQLMGFAAQLRQHPNTHFYESGELSSDLITCITQDHQGYTWIATEYGLNRFDGIRFVHYFHSDSDSLSIGSDHVGSLLVDRDGNLWTACYERLQRYDAQTNNFVWAFTPDTIHGFNDLRQGKDGRILANSNRGVVEIHPKTMRVTLVKGMDVLPKVSPTIDGMALPQTLIELEDRTIDLRQQNISAVFVDKDGNIWIGCHRDGVVLFTHNQTPYHYVPLTSMPFSNGKHLHQLFCDREGRAYVMQDGNGIRCVNGTEAHGFFSGRTQTSTILSVFEDRAGNLWMGHYGRGLCRKDGVTGEETWTLDHQRIRAMAQDRDGWVYAAVFLRGDIHRYDSRTMREDTLWGKNLKLMNPYITKLFFDSSGLLWIGHYYGFEVYDTKKDRMVAIEPHPALRKAKVTGIIELKGKVWISSSKGLFQYDRKTGAWRWFTKNEGLSSDYCCSVILDDNGYLWVSTIRGLNCSVSAVDGNGSVERFASLYLGNGLYTTSYLPGVSMKAPDGTLYFGNEYGYTYVRPDQLQKSPFLRGLSLTSLTINGADCWVTDEVKCDYSDALTLCFSPLDYRNMDNVHLEYRFADERNSEWRPLDAGISEIPFIHLPSGTHVLEVRAIDKSEVSEVCRVTIRVLPPWYSTWWAYMIYGILVLMVLGLVVLLLRRRRLAAINEAKIQMFVDFSHEMRSPLTLIKSPVASLLRKRHSAEETSMLLGIQRNTDRLLGTVNQILSIRKIESGQLMLHRKPTDMLPFVKGIADDFRYQADALGVRLLVEGGRKGDGVFADIDRELFDKVVSNLLTNAMKYVERGGEIVVTIEKAADGGMMVLRVSDSGPGIAEKEQKKVFDMFYQAGSSNSVGFGIGLNFAYRIVKLHGGTIAVANRKDTHGAVFTVTMPACEAVEEEPQEEFAVVPEPQENGAWVEGNATVASRNYKKRPQIIVVDDDREVLDYLVSSLSASYKVSAFMNGQDALPEIISKVPDAVISDIKMPKMDGRTLLQRVRSNTKTIHVPVILLTSETSTEAHIEGFEGGADMYVDKPFDVVELEARLAGLIESRLRLKGKYSGAQEQEGIVQKVEMKGNDELLMERVMKVVNKYLTDESFSVEMLASEVGLSRVQLHRRMKEITGISVGDFIRNLRMQQAAELLAKGDLSVSQVAYAVGYVNPTHFATAFKKWSGMSPTEYVESVR